MNKIYPVVLLIAWFGSLAYSVQFEVVDQDGVHIPNAEIYLVSANNTKVSGLTKKSGFAYIKPVDDQRVTILCSGPGVTGYIQVGVNPNLDLLIKMKKIQDGGSVLFSEGNGNIPGVTGSLNPILDTSNRMYLYGREVAINDGQQQPVQFQIDRFFKVEDKLRKSKLVSISHIAGKIFLVNYKAN